MAAHAPVLRVELEEYQVFGVTFHQVGAEMQGNCLVEQELMTNSPLASLQASFAPAGESQHWGCCQTHKFPICILSLSSPLQDYVMKDLPLKGAGLAQGDDAVSCCKI